MNLQQVVDDVFRYVETYRGHGTQASVVPALADVDPKKLAIAVVLGDGSSYAAGDADEPLSLQSIAYVFSLSLALQRVGPALWNHVGREPAGSQLNALVQLETEKGKPRNPLINAGSIVVCDALIGDEDGDAAIEDLIEFLRTRCGGDGIAVDERVFTSESQFGHLNHSLAHYIAAYDNLTNPVDEVLSVYFRQCAITMTCRQIARAALYLAFDGKDPQTGDQVILSSRARRINALMLTCGHYDNSGEFAFRIGLPGKSGMSGGILTIVPGVGVVAVWSPGLNAAGSSLAGAVALEKLVERTGWSIFV